MKDWHYNVLFVLAVVGAVVMLFSDRLGVTVRPEVVGVFGLVMAFILQQKDSKKNDSNDDSGNGAASKRDTPDNNEEN